MYRASCRTCGFLSLRASKRMCIASFVSEKQVRVYVMLAYEDGEKPIFEQVVMRVDDDYDVDMQLHSLIKRLMEKGADDILCYYQSLEY